MLEEDYAAGSRGRLLGCVRPVVESDLIYYWHTIVGGFVDADENSTTSASPPG